LLQRATEAGRNISQLAKLSDAELTEIVRTDEAARPGEAMAGGGPEFMAALYRAVEALDGTELEHLLRRALATMGTVGVVDSVVVPLMVRIGEQWHGGGLNPAQEHLASAVVHQVLGEVLHDLARGTGTDRRILVATPRGQRHGLGALLVALSAAALGWRVTFLGVDLPIPDIRRAIEMTGPEVVALSLAFPPDDPTLGAELRALCRDLPERTVLLLGGAAAPGYAVGLPEEQVRLLADLPALRRELAGFSPRANR
jgi:methanogenic corrinoid protein MtbC1